MVPRLFDFEITFGESFRAVLFRMVPRHRICFSRKDVGFRAVLFRMVPRLDEISFPLGPGFRAVLFRMVPRH